MGFQDLSHLYRAEPFEFERIRVIDEVEPVEIDYTLPTDRLDDHAPARVNPLLRGPMQTPAAPSAAGPTGAADARSGGPSARQHPDPTHLPDAA